MPLPAKFSRLIPGFCALVTLGLASVGVRAEEVTSSDSVEVLYAEPVSPLQVVPQASAKTSLSHIDRRLSFDAFGKRFSVALAINPELQAALATSVTATSFKLYRGELLGVSGSWVRLAAGDSGELRGMLWDGNELYVVDSVDRLRGFLTQAANVPESGNVIFRLSDTKVDLGPNFCAAQPDANPETGLQLYKAVAKELRASPKTGIDSELEVSVIGDASYLARYANTDEAQSEALVRLNNVDGIFSAQIGVGIRVASLKIETSQEDPFSSTTNAGALLGELAGFRSRSAEQRTYGLTHLLTGRDLDGSTVGIAYVNSVCSSRYGVGLSEIRGRGAWTESLITAHEMGHNFGAVHDGEGVCSATSNSTFLMAPRVNGNGNFSQCSLDHIIPVAKSAACLVPVQHADIGIAADLGAKSVTTGQTMTWDISVSNNDTAVLTQPQLTVSLNGTASFVSASGTGMTCSVTATSVDCSFSTLSPGTTQVAHLTLLGDAAGSAQLTAQVSADNDEVATNNSGTGSLAVQALLTTNSSSSGSQTTTPASTTSSGGGGGSTDVVWLCVLLSIAGAYRLTRHQRATLSSSV